MIRNYCVSGDIVFDVDPDDELIGRQVFNLINSIYLRTDKWFVYSNNILNHEDKPGRSKEIPKDTFKAYRTTEHFWATTHLKTFLRDLYMKIPPEHLFEDL